jgi:hypothetical protein
MIYFYETLLKIIRSIRTNPQIERWYYITLLVFVEFMSCSSSHWHQPWTTIGGCMTMLVISYSMSMGYGKKK